MGPGPNPLLQNHILMAVHPPLLYLGYVGMSVPFAFAHRRDALGRGRDDDWIRLTRRWTLVAWVFLSAAIIAGMWWSYEVLGWGGYWAWDPVENASFMPWLTATAFLHSVMVQERRGMLKLWNLNLDRRHVRAHDPRHVPHALAASLVGARVHRRADRATTSSASSRSCCSRRSRWWPATPSGCAPTGNLDAAASRETVFLLNNLFLTAFTFTVLVGTLFPLVAEAIRGVKVSVGEPFFNRMTLPICVALLFLMGVGPALPWRARVARGAARQLLPPTVGAVVALVVERRDRRAHLRTRWLAFAFGGFALAANLREFWIGAAREAARAW